MADISTDIDLLRAGYLLSVNQIPDAVVRQTFGAPAVSNVVYFQFLYEELLFTGTRVFRQNRVQLFDPMVFSHVDTRHRLFSLLTTVFSVPMASSAKIVRRMTRVVNEAFDEVTDATAPIGVEVVLCRVTFGREDDGDDVDDEWLQRVIEQLGEGNKVNFVPASGSAIDKLERVRYEGRDGNCVVCLTDFEEGCEVTKTPCAHLYHRDCIVKWLSTSHVCPICRFELPTDDSSSDMEIC